MSAESSMKFGEVVLSLIVPMSSAAQEQVSEGE
jgi:hypothetical protein